MITSQLFSNIYMDCFDKYVKKELNIKYYGRYVDDFVIVHKDKEYLKSIIPKINNYLVHNLGLNIHPKKIYLQHYSSGVMFLGAFIKPYRTYIRKRTIGYFYQKIISLNTRLKNNNYKLEEKLKKDFLSVVNSYLGFLKQYKSYRIRKKILLNNISANFWNYFYISNNYSLVKVK